MTTTTEILTWTLDDRLAFVRELAEQVALERNRNTKPYTRAANALIPHVADHCPEPLLIFARLVDATAEYANFNQHPRWDGEAAGAERDVERLLRQLVAA